MFVVGGSLRFVVCDYLLFVFVCGLRLFVFWLRIWLLVIVACCVWFVGVCGLWLFVVCYCL